MIPEESRRHAKAAQAVREGRPVAARYVRGGRRGSRVLAILVASTAVVAVLLLAIWAAANGVFINQNPTDAQQAADARAFDEAGPPAPDVATAAAAVSD
jgi:hypothetical protein